MIKLYNGGVFLVGSEIIEDTNDAPAKIEQMTGKTVAKEEAKKGTIAHAILKSHNAGENEHQLKLKFDSLTSHDITYVGIIQTAIASGLTKFPVPYVLTNCHNSLCAVGGTINEDDHMFALSAAKRFGGVYVPTNLAVIHQFNREMMAGPGKMILGSDSHTRYGALGTMAVGEGGGELAKQLLSRTYDMQYPQVVAVYLTGKPSKAVGPQDVALSIIGKVFANGYVKNKVMEFIGDGVGNLDVEYRNGIDVMTTETTCWSSVWKTDGKVKTYLEAHDRAGDYKKLEPGEVTYYDGCIYVDLSTIKPSIALPFHPSNVYTIDELKKNPLEILKYTEEEALKQLENKSLRLRLADKVINGDIYVDQGIIAGCAGGTYDNIVDTADILNGKSVGNGAFAMSVYPSSQPAYIQLIRNGSIEKLMAAGAIVRSAFCGPCFGAGDTPANGEFSIRHTTRNFPNREGSKPGEGQVASVALMDARSIAATAINSGKLTSAEEIDFKLTKPAYYFDKGIYEKRVLNATDNHNASVSLVMGPNIKEWPKMPSLTDDLLVKVVTYIDDPVTTTDELIPSGETSSFRSNPERLSEFALSRKAPDYVPKSKQLREIEVARENGVSPAENAEIAQVFNMLRQKGLFEGDEKQVGIGSSFFANKPGDGSAREQAASCQKVLGGWANFAKEYATKRYRSNLINWGIIPFIVKDGDDVALDSYVYIKGIRATLLSGQKEMKAYVVNGHSVKEIAVYVDDLTGPEKQIIASGCLINYYNSGI
ncbi:hydratase [Oscillospiraceae bacterium LTW-04]|nr:hydratase [Oscillospiraceae bacterium MB24-C1]